jgi:hypothetical protein
MRQDIYAVHFKRAFNYPESQIATDLGLKGSLLWGIMPCYLVKVN